MFLNVYDGAGLKGRPWRPSNHLDLPPPVRKGLLGNCCMRDMADGLTHLDRPPASRAARKRVEHPRLIREPVRVSAGVLELLPCSNGDVLFLDVETTGLSKHYDEVTLVGYLVDSVYEVFIRGDNPDRLLQALEAATTLVTFNGTIFDIPFLRKTFGDILLPPNHIDLRYAARRVGLTGGQKAIEIALGLRREEGLEAMDGAAAVLLWHRYLRGEIGALRTLIAYNRADVAGMLAILDHILRADAQGRLFGLRRYDSSAVSLRGYAAPGAVLPAASRLGRRSSSFADVFDGTVAKDAVIVGVDLTGSAKRPSGVSLLKGCQASTILLATDDEIVAFVASSGAKLVSIDSPLSLPNGRASPFDDDPGRDAFGIMRQSERELKRRGINVYPCLLPSMQRLTQRGIALADRLRAMGFPVIESYPGAAQDIIGIPRKGAGERFLKEGLAGFGIEGSFQTDRITHDELDAITSALVGSFFLAGRYEGLGGGGENPLIVPKLDATPRPHIIGVSGRIAAGKTTFARMLEARGFRYTRVSLVIDEELRMRGLTPDRRTRQALGDELHRTKGQRWLCERALDLAPTGGPLVVDGLRWPEDHAVLAERGGGSFVHVHIRCSQEMRRRRYKDTNGPGGFDTADAHAVEVCIDGLEELAASSIINEGALADLEKAAEALAACAIAGASPCQSQ